MKSESRSKQKASNPHLAYQSLEDAMSKNHLGKTRARKHQGLPENQAVSEAPGVYSDAQSLIQIQEQSSTSEVPHFNLNGTTETPSAAMQAYFASPTAQQPLRPVSATLNQIRYWKQIQTATERFNRLSNLSNSKKRKTHPIEERPELRLNERSSSKLILQTRKGLQTPQVAVGSIFDIRSKQIATPLNLPEQHAQQSFDAQ